MLIVPIRSTTKVLKPHSEPIVFVAVEAICFLATMGGKICMVFRFAEKILPTLSKFLRWQKLTCRENK